MSNRASTTTAGTQPIPGYTLRNRLGAGGYGEVWLADAPGGLQKAIKLIYGNVDDARAANELRSLERIRSAHHPFILSLERIEVVQGKVIIVTELAESSLQDRFESCRRQGSPGIPRVELLNFLRDTADALDFLAQKHSLQHLDVKPGNLLIIAEHIKVADFGLVKDLHDPNHSLVSGLTPIYSAPEVFDGRPDFRSDQYSLAIVYMEMLTGRLPFGGRTPAELARQHLTQAPNLDPLPPADRSIVLRALSKNPLDRFTTCRQFVDQLLKVRSSVVPVQENQENNKASDESLSKSILATDTRNWTTGRKLNYASTIPKEQYAEQWTTPRAMFIGLGGLGVLALRELLGDLLQNVDHRLTSVDYGWLAVDTSRNELEMVVEGEKLMRLALDSAVLLPIQSPQTYRKLDPALFTPLSRRWLYNIPKSLTTEGVRPIATLALIANYPALAKLLESRILNLARQHQADADCKSPLRVYVTASLHGGTGSALLAEIGLMVRRVFSRLGFNNYRLCAVVSAATTTNRTASANLSAANAIATLSELSLLMRQTAEKPNLDYRSGLVTSHESPFDWVNVVDGGMLDDRKAASNTPKRLARCISLDCQTLASAALSSSRQAWRQNSWGWLRSVRTESIKEEAASTPEALSRLCCAQVLTKYLSYLTGDGSGPSSTCKEASGENSKLTRETSGTLSSTFLPLSPEVIQQLVQRTLGDMQLLSGQAPEDEFKASWFARLSDNPSSQRQQMARDLNQWHRWIVHHTKVRIYNWRQTQRIQLEIVQGLLNFLDHQLPTEIEKLRPTAPFSALRTNLLDRACEYIKDLLQECVQFMDIVGNEQQAYTTTLQNWQRSLAAGNAGIRFDFENGHAGLGAHSQQLLDHLIKLLEDRLAAKFIAVFELATTKLGLQLTGDNDTLTSGEATMEPTGQEQGVEPGVTSGDDDKLEPLQSEADLLQLSQKLVVQTCKQMGLNPDDLECHTYHFSTIAHDDIREAFPASADGGGEIVRMIITNRDQHQHVENSLRKMGIASTTTIIHGTPSLGIQVVCDAVNLNIPQLVSALWRPTGATLNLAERLRTRVDIEWDDASTLLSVNSANMIQVNDYPEGKDPAPLPSQMPLTDATVIPLSSTQCQQ